MKKSEIQNLLLENSRRNIEIFKHLKTMLKGTEEKSLIDTLIDTNEEAELLLINYFNNV